jgi:nucleotide-binding universal stress UspA family protein
MKKILVAFDGSFYSESALSYAIQLASYDNSLIQGIFLEDLTAYHQFSPLFDVPDLFDLSDRVIEDLKQENRQNIEINIQRFENTCQTAGIQYAVEMKAGIPAIDLLHETAFADIVITGAVTYFSNLSYSPDKSLVSDLLGNALCPVIIVPENYRAFKQVVFAYDGSSASQKAIKCFVRLFPGMLNRIGSSLLIVNENEIKRADIEKTHQYLNLYTNQIKLEEIKGVPSQEILHYSKINQNAMLVLGASGRNIFTDFFSKSVGKKIVKSNSIPVFIMHH